jgi:5-methylcytosine-specific restriction protein A
MSNPFQHEKRRDFTVLERAKFFAHADGRCEKCTRKIPHGDEWDIDHIIALSRGGTNDDSNLQVLCSWCHDAKTDDDKAGAAKSKRLYAKHFVPKRFQRSRSWGRRA